MRIERIERPITSSQPTLFPFVPMRVGVISNPRSHRNRSGMRERPQGAADLLTRQPRNHAELLADLNEMARCGIDLLVIDGGDGTVRDVLTVAAEVFDHQMPALAVLASGKTNALALDLGVPITWSLQDVLDHAAAGRFTTRSPIEVYRAGSPVPESRGFLLGAGGFVRATEAAQSTHRLGAFNGIAVGLSLAWAVAQTFFGGARNPWRVGERMRIEHAGEVLSDRALYLLLTSTLERLPIGLKPFGPVRPEMKMLMVDAPPKWLPAAVPVLLSGAQPAWLRRFGYRTVDLDTFALSVDGGFILDGEHYAGGDIVVRRGAPLRMVAP